MASHERQSPFLPVILAWLVPGAGHLKIGKLWPGVFTFAAILPLYVGGMALAGFENVSYARHPIYFFAVHVFGGVLTGAAELLTRGVVITQPLPDKTAGELFTAVACLLNLVAISDVWSRCRRGDPEDRVRSPAEPASPVPASSMSSVEPNGSPAPEVSGG